MAYKVGCREQLGLFPERIEDYVSEDDPVRVYDAFVESLDMEELGIEVEIDKTGAPAYDPKALLKLLIYGPSYGIKSGRKLERATHHNVSFMWLVGGLKPDYRTIMRFRKRNKQALSKVLRQSVRLCMKLGLVEGNILFVDGSKFRANASVKRSWDKGRCRDYLKELDKRIDDLVEECEHLDEEEHDKGSLVKMSEDLKDSKKLRERIRGILDDLEGSDAKSINTTDRESVRVKGRQGGHQGYTSQVVVDDKHGLIVSTDVVSQNNDNNQLMNQVAHAEEILGKGSEVICADAGYSDIDEIKVAREKRKRIIIPSKWQANQNADRYSKDKFSYDEENDEYICPAGKILRRQKDRGGQRTGYVIEDARDCERCGERDRCTSNKRGRRLSVDKEEYIRREHEREYLRPENRAIYRRRKEKVELPFGHIKRNLNGGSFLLRGRAGVKAEMSVYATCFNIARMITLLGVRGLVNCMLKA